MDVKKAYCYWFYKYYSFLEKYDQTRWMSQTKAMIIINALEIGFIGTIYTYVKIITTRYSITTNLGAVVIFILAGIVVAFKVLAFKDDAWKKYIKEFEEWDTSTNKGNWIVVGLTIAIFLNFLFSVSFWRHMRGWDTW